MAQISLYIEDAVADKLSAVARLKSCSVSKYVAALVTERLSKEELEEQRKKELLRKLRGAVKDPTLTEPPELLAAAGSERRYDLI